MDIYCFWYAQSLLFNAVKNLSFPKMIESVSNYEKRFKPPYYEVHVNLLKREVVRVNDLEKYEKEWSTLMSNNWSDGKFRSITNFF